MIIRLKRGALLIHGVPISLFLLLCSVLMRFESGRLTLQEGPC